MSARMGGSYVMDPATGELVPFDPDRQAPPPEAQPEPAAEPAPIETPPKKRT